jgi:hypothetical protein
MVNVGAVYERSSKAAAHEAWVVSFTAALR